MTDEEIRAELEATKMKLAVADPKLEWVTIVDLGAYVAYLENLLAFRAPAPIDNLSDTNSRVILSAFQMSPAPVVETAPATVEVPPAVTEVSPVVVPPVEPDPVA